jgi:hypothetical protein
MRSQVRELDEGEVSRKPHVMAYTIAIVAPRISHGITKYDEGGSAYKAVMSDALNVPNIAKRR